MAWGLKKILNFKCSETQFPSISPTFDWDFKLLCAGIIPLMKGPSKMGGVGRKKNEKKKEMPFSEPRARTIKYYFSEVIPKFKK